MFFLFLNYSLLEKNDCQKENRAGYKIFHSNAPQVSQLPDLELELHVSYWLKPKGVPLYPLSPLLL